MLCPLEIDPIQNCTGGWVGLRAGLDGCGKIRPNGDSIPGSSSPQRVVPPTELSRLIIRSNLLGPREVEAPRITRQSGHEGGKFVNPTQRLPMKTGSEPIGNQNRYLTACIAGTQPNAPPRAARSKLNKRLLTGQYLKYKYKFY
jgi:hypothetical protein